MSLLFHVCSQHQQASVYHREKFDRSMIPTIDFWNFCIRLCSYLRWHSARFNFKLYKIYWYTFKIYSVCCIISRHFRWLSVCVWCFQLPPAPQNSFKQRTIERFKKPLFCHGSDAYNLKVELNKVLDLEVS